MKTYRLLFTAPLAIVALVSVAAPQYSVHAHGGGQLLEKSVGDYTIGVEYEALVLAAGDPVRLNFTVAGKDAREETPFTDIWINISRGNKTVFAGGLIKSALGATGMTYAFPESGDYALNARFHDKGNAIAEASFPLRVEEAEGTDRSSPEAASRSGQLGIAVLAGLIIGFVLALFMKKRKAANT